MSECIVTASAITALSSSASTAAASSAVVGGALLAGGLILAGTFCAYKSIRWLSETQTREMEKIAEELITPIPTYLTSEEARKDFQEKFRLAKAHAERSPALKMKATQ